MTRERELETVRRQGKRIRTAHLEVRYVARSRGVSRAGIVVPRYAHGAVLRNRVKRQLREIVRLHVLPGFRGVDMIVRALPSAYQASFAELREQCLDARARLSRAPEP